MIIEDKDFRLTPINEHSLKFDLELLYKVKPKGKDARYEYKTVAYGISLEHAIKKIAQYRVHCNQKDASIQIMQYFKVFKSELDSLKDTLKS